MTASPSVAPTYQPRGSARLWRWTHPSRQGATNRRGATMIRIFCLLTAAFLFASSLAIADVITSTPTGGPWQVGGTWMGGIVPDGNDDVVIQGPVVVQGSAACLTLDVRAAGSLRSGSSPSVLVAGGTITNAGTVADGPLSFRIEIGGDLTNQAQWTNQQTSFTGATDHHLVAGGGSIFESDLIMPPAATGDVIVETPFAILGNIDMRDARMDLQPDCPLTLRGSALCGEVLCNGNEVRFESWSYLNDATLDQAVLVGEVEVAVFSTFTGGLTVMDVLQNLRSSGNGSVTIEGGLVNHGLIQNDHYGFHVDLAGDLSCDGVIRCPMLALDEDLHHLTMGPQGDLQVAVVLPEFVPGTLVVDSPVRISDGLSLGMDGTMILSPGASVHLADRGALSGGTVFAAGNPILIDGLGGGGLTGTTIDNGVLQGTIQVSMNCAFTDGVAIEGTLQSAPFFSPEINVTGRLLNTGLIQNGTMPLKIRARGDVVNEGAWTNARLTVDGTEDQAIEIGDGLAVPEVVFESGLVASAYQWFLDGEPIPGATAPNLTFATLNAGDTGSYRCDGDGIPSRIITVTASPSAGVPGSGSEAPTPTLLGVARPNPFQSATTIDFALDAPAPVRLSAFDVAGRLVAVLVDERRSAGRHAIPWQADDLAPGVYFLRLEAGSTHLVRKVTRLE